MPRRYRRKSYRITRPLKAVKYSSETYAGAANAQFLANSLYKSTAKLVPMFKVDALVP